MADASEVRLIINAVDNASKVLSGTTKSVSNFSKALGVGQDMAAGMGINLNALSNPAMAAGQGIKMVTDYVKGAIDDTMAYTQTVKEMSMTFAAAPEEISRMIQAGDDMGVSMEEMRTSMQFMNRNGLAPTIDNLAALADRTNLILDPTQRADELVKLLGRSYTKLDPLLKQGGDSIRALAASQSDALVVTQAEIDASERNRRALDQWEDSLQSIKYTIGNAVIPVMTDFVTALNNGVEGLTNLKGGVDLLVDANNKLKEDMKKVDPGRVYKRMAEDGVIYAVALRSIIAEQEAVSQAAYITGYTYATAAGQVQDYARSMYGADYETNAMTSDVWDLTAAGRYERDMFIKLNDVTEYNAAKTKAAAAEQDKLVKQMQAVSTAVSGPLKSANEGYWQTMGDLSKRADELYAAMEKLRLTGRGNTNEARALKEEYDGLIPKMDEAKAALERTTAEMIYQQAVEGMAPAAALEFARALGLISESDYNLATAINTVKEKHEAGLISEDKYKEGMLLLYDAAKDGVLTLDEVKTAMEKLDGMVANATINVGLTGPGANWKPPAGGGLPPGKAPKQTQAGGPVYANQSLIVGERGWEPFIPAVNGRILSHNDAMRAMQKTTNNYFTLNLTSNGRNENVAGDFAIMQALAGAQL